MHAWEQIQKTVDYIEQHLDEPLSVELLSKNAALSPFYFQRLFSRLVKKPVAEYVRLRRVARAAEILARGEGGRLLDLALELGFGSHGHFTRAFKETFGMTPEDYRAAPRPLNRMTKPQLMLQYVLVDEGVPLIADGVVLEMGRQSLQAPRRFVGLEKRMPAGFVDGLGTESGVNPLHGFWQDFHERKTIELGLDPGAEELGVAHPCAQEGQFTYFAGACAGESRPAPAGPKQAEWVLPAGEYVVCSFEAESFEAMVMDALYKAQQYLFGVWLPRHKLQTEPFCAERYTRPGPGAAGMELWVKTH